MLRAYLLAIRDCPHETLPPGLSHRLHDMIEVVAVLATKNGQLPALQDTPYGGARWDDEIAELCLLAAQLPHSPSLVFLRPKSGESWREAEAAGWLGGDDLGDLTKTGRSSRLFPDAGYAVLSGTGYRAILDFGPHGGSHGHLGKLALYLYGPTAGWQPAYGVPPYAHSLRRDYYRRTAAHPTLTVDGADQREATGQLLYWRPGPSTVVGASAEVYPGVRFERHVRADPEHLVDVVRVAADRDRDFVLHLRSDVDTQVRHTAIGYQTWWPGDGGLTGHHASIPAAALGTGPDLGPADDPIRSGPVRTCGGEFSADKRCSYRPIPEPPPGSGSNRPTVD
ncbi:heparinase II/III domain-containing protein [Fodinicola feengrottensis]|uniref:heparinase II/III domain-containing protein n=1 Tax=Fodinicola feengrottensis TaxID=435914 RepID=UPI002440F3BE|nr:heparinase II/III family protein [Fodinicola feengrottensis]